MTSTNNVAWAATINCPNATPVPPLNVNCIGTNDADNMQGTANHDKMVALDGNDTMFRFASNDEMIGDNGEYTMSGGSGDDFLDGQPGNDNINGDSGDDVIVGFSGADILKGSSGNDRIFHFISGQPTNTDLSKDTIDCGSGNDEAWINVRQDGDTAINCETVHSDINP